MYSPFIHFLSFSAIFISYLKSHTDIFRQVTVNDGISLRETHVYRPIRCVCATWTMHDVWDFL